MHLALSSKSKSWYRDLFSYLLKKVEGYKGLKFSNRQNIINLTISTGMEYSSDNIIPQDYQVIQNLHKVIQYEINIENLNEDNDINNG